MGPWVVTATKSGTNRFTGEAFEFTLNHLKPTQHPAQFEPPRVTTALSFVAATSSRRR